MWYVGAVGQLWVYLVSFQDPDWRRNPYTGQAVLTAESRSAKETEPIQGTALKISASTKQMSQPLMSPRENQITWPNKVTNLSGLPRTNRVPRIWTFSFKTRKFPTNQEELTTIHDQSPKSMGRGNLFHRRKLGNSFKQKYNLPIPLNKSFHRQNEKPKKSKWEQWDTLLFFVLLSG